MNCPHETIDSSREGDFPRLVLSALSPHEAFLCDARRYLQGACPDAELLQTCRASLGRRGFDVDRLDRAAIGLFVNPAVMRAGLLRAGFTRQEIAAAGLVGDARLTGRLVGPIRHPQGRIISFWARHPADQGPKCLYLNRNWEAETPAFGLDAALPRFAEEDHELLLVADLLDALSIQAAGFLRVAAVASFGRNLTADRWQRLAALGTAGVTLLVDDDARGRAATIAAVMSCAQAEPAPQVFVLPTDRLGRRAELAALVRQLGPETFWAMVKGRRIAGQDYAAPPQPTEPPQGSELPPGFCRLHQCDRMVCFCWD